MLFSFPSRAQKLLQRTVHQLPIKLVLLQLKMSHQMNHILRKITDQTTTLLTEHQIEIISQLMDRTRNLNRLRLTIDLNSRTTFQRVLQVVRKKTTIFTQIQGTTTIQELISGVVSLVWQIRDKIHMKQVLALTRKLPIQGHKPRTFPKTHIKIHHPTLRMAKSIRKILVKWLVVTLIYCSVDITHKLMIYRVNHHVLMKNILEMIKMIGVTMHRIM